MKIVSFFITCSLSLLSAPIIRVDSIDPDKAKSIKARNVMIVCQDDKAAEIGKGIIEQGGNAADAGIAIAYALAVTQPKAGNLGGGGFALYYDAASRKTIALDFRERAPEKANVKKFLKEDGTVDKNLIRFSPLACAVPGTLAGLGYLSENFGNLKHKTVIEPAIYLAEDGFPISAGLANDLKVKREFLEQNPNAKKIFYPGGKLLKEGDILTQKTLSETLKRLQKYGPQYFYTGPMGREFVRWHKQNGGIINMVDLKNYKVAVRDPIKGSYRDHTILSMPAPSSGGMHLIQMLNILEHYNLKKMSEPDYLHLMAETMKLAYADRSHFPGDPDLHPIPQQGLISKKYATTLKESIDLNKARPSSEIKHGDAQLYESNDTTHFSITDREGNVLSFTYTINYSFGSGIIVPELGFFLNNEMDDFALLKKVPNSYGLIGGEANLLKAGKRPLSSMTPTIVFKKDSPFLVTGSPGGSRIITTVLQTIVNVIDFEMEIRDAALRPRIHHQWLPDRLEYEAGISPEIVEALKNKGHNVEEVQPFGCTETIMIRYDGKHGFADPRRMDGKAVGL